MKAEDISMAVPIGSVIEFFTESTLGIAVLHNICGELLVLHPKEGLGFEEKENPNYVQHITLIPAEQVICIYILEPAIQHESTKSTLPKNKRRKTSN